MYRDYISPISAFICPVLAPLNLCRPVPRIYDSLMVSLSHFLYLFHSFFLPLYLCLLVSLSLSLSYSLTPLTPPILLSAPLCSYPVNFSLFFCLMLSQLVLTSRASVWQSQRAFLGFCMSPLFSSGSRGRPKGSFQHLSSEDHPL